MYVKGSSDCISYLGKIPEVKLMDCTYATNASTRT